MSGFGFIYGFNVDNRVVGGAAPPPPPPSDTPIIFSDFKNGVYEINGTSAALADMWEENLDYGPFSPTNVVSGLGLNTTDKLMPAAPALTSDCFDLLGTDGVVIVYDFIMTLTDVSNTIMGLSAELFDLPNFSESWLMAVEYRPSADPTQGAQVNNYSNVFPPLVARSQAGGVLIGTSRRFAGRLAPDTLAASFAGEAPVQSEPPDPAVFTNFGLVVRTNDDGTSSTIERISIYSATDYSVADLQELSS